MKRKTGLFLLNLSLHRFRSPKQIGSVKMLNSFVLKATSEQKRFNLAHFKQQETNTPLLFAIEDSHFLFHRLFNISFQTLDSINDHISQSFTDFLNYKLFSRYLINKRTSRNDKLLYPFTFQDLIESVGSKYEQKTQDYLPHNNGSEGKGDPDVAFNILDAILKDSLERLKLMRESMSLPHVNTIRNLSLEGKLDEAVFIRNKMIHKGVIPDIITHNYLINGFCKVGAFEKAEWLVKDMSYWGLSPNCVTYNTLMKGYYAFNDIDKALIHLSTMNANGNKVTPNVVSFNIMLHALCKKGLLEEARVLLPRFSDENGQRNLLASTMLMDNYFKKGDTSLALKHWGEICEMSKEVDVVAYNVIVHGSYINWGVIVAYKYVNKMLKIGLIPDNFTYNTLISGLCKAKRIDEACYIYTVMLKMGVFPDLVSYNILIQGLCKVGNMVKANELLNCMLKNSIIPKPFIWNIIINGYGKNGDKQNTLRVIDQMMKNGVSANVFTYNALILMFIKSGEIVDARLLMKEMLVDGPLPDTVTYNLLVGAESEFGHLYSAKEVYDDMLERGFYADVVTYTELIKGYCNRGKVKEAERVFSFDMLSRDSGLVIDHVPFQILMKKYFKMRDFDSVYGVYLKWLRLDKVE